MLSRTQAEHYGLAQRNHLSRSALAALHGRQFDPMEVLRQASRQHIAKLLPLKFRLMSGSPFVFFRGSVEIMAADLGEAKHTRIEVQICGDAHVKNFGFYATPGSDIVLDVNDFDETMRGPWEWDVKRMATSVILAGRVAGGGDALCKDAARTFICEYCAWIRRFAGMPALDVARHRTVRNYNDPVIRSALRQAERSSPLSNLQKLTRRKAGGGYSFTKSGLVWDVQGEERKAVLQSLPDYRATLAPEHQMLFDRFKAVDVGFKVVGTGSVGTRDYVVLFLGADEKDPLFLQVKEEPPSAYAAYYKDRSIPKQQGQRVVRGQRALQVASDLLLGWCSIAGRDYLVRQLNDHKSSIEPEELQGKRLATYSRVCGELLAKGHARSGTPVALAAYMGSSDKAERALLQFAVHYADQVEADHAAFRKALKHGFLDKAMKAAQGTSARGGRVAGK
jgi:uncharacterized protein (DUF2252 family)